MRATRAGSRSRMAMTTATMAMRSSFMNSHTLELTTTGWLVMGNILTSSGRVFSNSTSCLLTNLPISTMLLPSFISMLRRRHFSPLLVM